MRYLIFVGLIVIAGCIDLRLMGYQPLDSGASVEAADTIPSMSVQSFPAGEVVQTINSGVVTYRPVQDIVDTAVAASLVALPVSESNDTLNINAYQYRSASVAFDIPDSISGYFADGTIIATRGFYSPGDAGSAVYRVQADSVTGYVTDTIAVIPLSSGNYAVLNSPTAVYPVEWFGAKGDSTTNDSAAVVKAMNYGRHILFSRPTAYWLNSTVVVPDNTIIEAVDSAKIYRNVSGKWFDCNWGFNVTFDNVTLVSHGTSNFQEFIDADRSTNLTVTGCDFSLTTEPSYGETMQGILARGAYNVLVSHNRFKYLQVKLSGAAMYTKNAWILNNDFIDPYNFAVSNVIDGTGDTIEGCWITDNRIHGVASQGGIFVGSDGSSADPPTALRDIYIDRNIISGAWADPGDITTTIGISLRFGYYNSNISVSDNRIINDIGVFPGNTTGIQIVGMDSGAVRTEGVRIIGNHINRMDKWGIRVSSGGHGKGFVIKDNYMKRNRGIDFTIDSTGVDGLEISSNHFDSLGVEAIVINGSGDGKGLIITDNVIEAPTAGSLNAVEINGDVDSTFQFIFEHNYIAPGWNRGLYPNTSEAAVFEGIVGSNLNYASTPYGALVTTDMFTDHTLEKQDITLGDDRIVDLNTHSLILEDATSGGNQALKIYKNRTGSGATPKLQILNNDITWSLVLDGATQNLYFSENGNDALEMEAGAGDHQIVIQNGGGVSFGTTTQTQRYHYQYSGNFKSLWYSSSASGTVGLQIANSDRTWEMKVDGGNAERFAIEDITAGTVPFRILAAAPTSSLWINAAGEVYVNETTDNGAYALQVQGDTRLEGTATVTSTASDAGHTTNGPFTLTPSASINNISAGTGLSAVTKGILRVQGNGGAVNITANPQIVDGADGQILIIVGGSDTNTLTFDDGTGLALAGAASFVMGAGDILILYYDLATDTWWEMSRSDN